VIPFRPRLFKWRSIVLSSAHQHCNDSNNSTMRVHSTTTLFFVKLCFDNIMSIILKVSYMKSNNLEYCFQTLDIHGHRVLQLILFCLWLYNYWEYVIECIFAVEGHILLIIWLILLRVCGYSYSRLFTFWNTSGILTCFVQAESFDHWLTVIVNILGLFI
jgi:hypothetical protein